MAELSIDVTEQGDGERPKVGDTVMMHYILWANQGVTSSEYDYDKEEYPDEESIMDATFYWAFENGDSFIIQRF